tara:strand:+ start:55 stop:576 length:522 start_codon:yes stop_codon:yes gene_type:complete
MSRPFIKMTHFTEPIKVNRKSGYKKKKIVTKLKPKTIKLDPLDGVDISKWKVAELKAELKKRGLEYNGKKYEVLERLQNNIRPPIPQKPLPLLPTWTEWWRAVGLKRMPYTLTALRKAGKTSIPPEPPWGVKLSHDYYNMYRNGLITEYKKQYPTGTKKIAEIPYDHIATKFD